MSKGIKKTSLVFLIRTKLFWHEIQFGIHSSHQAFEGTGTTKEMRISRTIKGKYKSEESFSVQFVPLTDWMLAGKRFYTDLKEKVKRKNLFRDRKRREGKNWYRTPLYSHPCIHYPLFYIFITTQTGSREIITRVHRHVLMELLIFHTKFSAFPEYFPTNFFTIKGISYACTHRTHTQTHMSKLCIREIDLTTKLSQWVIC